MCRSPYLLLQLSRKGLGLTARDERSTEGHALTNLGSAFLIPAKILIHSMRSLLGLPSKNFVAINSFSFIRFKLMSNGLSIIVISNFDHSSKIRYNLSFYIVFRLLRSNIIFN